MKSKINNLFLIVGPSGSGKSTIEAELTNRLGTRPVISYTDREPRFPGESSHVFVSPSEFEQRDYVAYTEFAGHRYGATAEQVDNAQTYVIDIAGITDLLQRYQTERQIHVIGITAPESLLKERMLARGDSEESVENRLRHDGVAFEKMTEVCDVIVPNVKLEKAVKIVERFILCPEQTL